MENANRMKNVIIIILLLILGFLAYITMSNNAGKIEALGLVESLNAEVIQWRDKDSLNHAKIQVIETGRTNDFLAIKSNDSTVIALQKTVERFEKYLERQGSVTNITNVTEVHNHYETVVSYDKDSLPVYSSEFNLDNWVIGNIVASKDTTLLKLKYKSDYSIVLGTEKDGWFKRKSFVEVIDKNPYSSNLNVRTYQVKQPRVKRFGVGPYVGFGVGNSLVPQVNIGVGLSFNLIQF